MATDKKISELTNYTPALDADVIPINDTANSITKKITWSNIKATLKSYFDTLYLTSANIEDTIVNGHTTIAPSSNAVFDALALKTENPMTAAGDIIYGGTSGTPTRLAKGTSFQVLKMNSGATAPEWTSGTSFPETQIFSGTCPNDDFTDLNLSSYIGTNQKMVMIRVVQNSTTPCKYTFRMNGDTNTYGFTATTLGYNSVNNTYLDSDFVSEGIIIVKTDTSGIIEWTGFNEITNMTLTLISFW